jgi:thymidylate kinase
MKKSSDTTKSRPTATAPHPLRDAKSKDTPRSNGSAVPARIRNLLQLRQLRDAQQKPPLAAALRSRFIIVEGISGSGKDLFQQHLRDQLKDRLIYEYSEGDVLLSWSQLQIDGIDDLRIKLLKLFVKYAKRIIEENADAVFLVNRFHLSTYVLSVHKKRELEREYNEVLELLRGLPVHIFIMQVNDEEIVERSSHPERSVRWQNFQAEIAKADGFRNVFERYRWQQKSMLQAAKKDRIPYSVLNLSDVTAESARAKAAPVRLTARSLNR